MLRFFPILMVAVSPMQFALAAEAPPTGVFQAEECDGTFPHHFQGVCTNEKDAIYWNFTTTLVKTDPKGPKGRVSKKVVVATHHGDLCHVGGKLYVAVNLGIQRPPRKR
jgi:hypothetical protein